MKKSGFAWLLIVPAIVLAFNFCFVKNQGQFFMNWTDPTYAYLLNGLNLANGNMEVGHIDHPGTTVQIASAFFIKIIHLTSGRNSDLAIDVLTDPERYLHILSFIFVLSSCLILFYLGVVIKRVSNSIPLAVFFQSGILVSFISLTCMADIRPEPFLIMGNTLLVLVCFSFIHEKEISTKRMFGYALKFGLICAFLLITKITAVPVLILPFFLLRKWKSWFVYVSVLLIFSILFLIPALPKMYAIIDWISRLSTHSGIYGQGEAKVVDFSVFKTNLWITFRDDLHFTITCLMLFSALVFLILKGKFKFRLWKDDVRLRLLTGIFLVTLLCVLIVAKHFKYHYLIPAFGLMMLGAYLSFQTLFSPTGKISLGIRNIKIPIVGISVIIIWSSYSATQQYYFSKNLHNPKLETAAVMEKYKHVPKLYMIYEYYFAEVPPAIYFGTCYAGDTRFDYYKKLKKIYPNAFFYSISENIFHGWGSGYDLEDLVSENKQILVSFYIQDTVLIQKSLDVLRQLNLGHKVIDLKRVYVNPSSGEQLYELNRIGKLNEISDSALILTCGVELINGGSLLSSDESTRFQGAEYRTTKEAHSGNASLGMPDKEQYGFGYKADVTSKKHFEITVWRKSERGLGMIMASGNDGKFVKSGFSLVEEGENGWEKIKLKFTVPDNYADSTVQIFVWNENNACYFDDLTIIQY